MNKEVFYVEKRFDDFSDCTDFYYEELGKLSQVVEMSKHERRRVHKLIMESMFASFKVLMKKEKQLNDINKTTDKELYDSFKKSRKQSLSCFSRIKKLFIKDCKVEVLDSNEVKMLEDSCSSEEKKCSCEDNKNIKEEISENFKESQSVNAESKGQCPVSHTDDTLKF